jgi:hypothetical protein
MPRSLVSQAGPLAMRRVLVADATYLKRSLSLDLPNQRSARVPYSGAPELTLEDC